MSEICQEGVYSLYSVDEERELFIAGDLADFFVDSDEPWRTFHALRYSASSRAAEGEIELLEVRVLDSQGGVLGAYSVSDVRIEEVKQAGRQALQLTGYLLSHPHPQAPVAWDRWRESSDLRKNAWVALSPSARGAWLECVRLHHHATARRTEADVSGGVYELDGCNITEWAGLYCAIGEALGGPGGYFGSTLDAFRDCLNGGFGLAAPFQVNWHSVQTARAHLGDAYVDGVVKTMRAAGVTVAFC